MVTYVRAGYFNEPDELAGVSHVLEHMYFKGTPTLGAGDVAREVKAVGGYLNAHTIYDHTSYYVVVPSSGFERALRVQADAYANSVIDANELGREIEVIVQEARRKLDNPAAVTRETLYELLHERHRMRRWRIGTEQGLRAFTRDDVHGFYRRHYTPSNTVLSVAGDVQVETVVRLVEELYSHLPAGDPPRDTGPTEHGPGAFGLRTISADVGQAQLAIGWRVPPLLHEDAPRLDVAAAILGAGRASRLHRGVRERRLVSAIVAMNYTPGDAGVFVIHAESRPPLVLNAAAAAWKVVESLAEHGPDDAELRRARNLIEARRLRRLETMEGKASHLAEWQALGDWRMGDRYDAQVLAADAVEVRDAVRRHLQLDTMSVVACLPTDAPPLPGDAAAVRGALERGEPVPLEPVSVAAAVPAPAVHTELRAERLEAGVHVFRTQRGVPLLVMERPGAPVACAGLYTLGGARQELPSRAGLTRLMVRTALKGTATRNAATLATAVELLGGSISGSAGADSFGWSISVPTRGLTPALELLADVALNPVFHADTLETERAVALAEVASQRDDMLRYPVRLAMEAVFGDHPYGVPVIGSEHSLRSVDPAMLHEWHAAQLLGGAPVLVVVGDVRAAGIATHAAALFSGLEAVPVPAIAPLEWPVERVVRREAREREQTALALALPGPDRRSPARAAATLLTGVASGLGGRLFEELRSRRSLAYTVSLMSVRREYAGMLVAYIGTDPDREGEARAGMRHELRRLAEDPVSADELTRARNYALGSHAIARQSAASVLADIVDNWMLGDGLHELDDFEHRLMAVNTEDVTQLAERALGVPGGEGVVSGRPPAAGSRADS